MPDVVPCCGGELKLLAIGFTAGTLQSSSTHFPIGSLSFAGRLEVGDGFDDLKVSSIAKGREER